MLQANVPFLGHCHCSAVTYRYRNQHRMQSSKINLYTGILLSIIIIFGCEQDSTKNQVTPTLNITRTAKLLLPPLTGTSSITFQASRLGGRESILFVNNSSNCLLQLYPDGITPALEHCFPLEGPNSPGKIYGASSAPKDEVIIASIKPNFYYYSGDNDPLRTISLKNEEEVEFGYGNFTSIYPNTFVNVKGWSYFLNLGKTPMNDLGKQVPDYPLVSAINNTTGELRATDFIFPSTYHSEKQLLTLPSLAGDKKKLVASLASGHNLYVYDTETKKTKIIDARSKYFPAEFRDKSSEDANEHYQYMAIEPLYLGIHYDRFRDLYYRIAKLPAGDNKDYILERSAVYSRFPRQFSVIVLDKNLNVIGEHLLPADTYVTRNITVIKEGLIISRMHPMNKSISTENSIEADIFVWSS